MNKPRSDPEFAIHLEGVPWTSSTESVILGPGVSLQRVGKGLSPMFPASKDTDDSSDESESMAWLKSPVDDLHYWAPDSTMNRLVDLVVATMHAPVFGIRVIPFRGKLLTADAMDFGFYVDGGQTGSLWNDATLDDKALSDIATGWQTLEAMRVANGYVGRLTNTVMLFQQAWKSPLLEHVCLNLDPFFRTLVGRAALGASDEHVALAVTELAEFLGHDSTATGEIVLRVLGVRNSTFNKGRVDQDEACDLGPPAFRLAASLLHRILLAKDVALAIDTVEPA